MRGLFLLTVTLTCFSLVSAAVVEIGPGRTHENIGDYPWESLAAGDTVLIYWRQLPYKEKWVIGAAGTENNWICVKGVPSQGSDLPVIDGRDATTRSQINFWNENRCAIKIGGSNSPPDSTPRYVIIENLEIKSCREPYSFTGRDGLTTYRKSASAIYIEKGEHITVKNCILHDCGNGFFTAGASKGLLIEGCYIYDNGVDGSIYEHNCYTESQGIIYQYNRFGPLRTGCRGNNLKDRSSGCIIRYNWIESGNRQLDLVETDFTNILNDPAYRQTYVYGNILIEPDGAGNSQICHYGGDGTLARFRKGTLYFYNNTVVSARTNNTVLLRLSTNDETCDLRNNIYYSVSGGRYMSILDQTGKVNMRNNWICENWRTSFSSSSADVNDIEGTLTGDLPGFTEAAAQDYSLAGSSQCINAGGTLASAVLPGFDVENEYVKHQGSQLRVATDNIDLGAFEYSGNAVQAAIPGRKGKPAIQAFPNPFSGGALHLRAGRAGKFKGCFEIVSIQGKIMFRKSLSPVTVWHVQDGQLPAGIYMARIVSENGKQLSQKKLVIIH